MEQKFDDHLEIWAESAPASEIKEYLKEYPDDFATICDSVSTLVLEALVPQLTPAQLMILVYHEKWMAVRDVLYDSIIRIPDEDHWAREALLKILCSQLLPRIF